MEKYKHANKALLDAIDSGGFEGAEYFNTCRTWTQKATFSHGRFMREYGWRVDQVGLHRAVIDWLQGLAINIPYMNVDILELAKKDGSLPKNPTEKQEDRILENYWSFMAMRLIGLWRKAGINVL